MNRHAIKNTSLLYGWVFIATWTVMVSMSGTVRAQKVEPPAAGATEAVPNIELKNDQLAARFLNQATAGATPEEVASLAAALAANPNSAFAKWIVAQYAKPVLPADLSLDIFRALNSDPSDPNAHKSNYSAAQGLRGSLMISDKSNELRRMVAYALSQIFVISDEDSPLGFVSDAMCDYHDLLYKDAFADFATILSDVTFHPAMSDYLSFDGNAKAGFYNKNSRPDENYAREVMQLFTIGLVRLNEDGSIVSDMQGRAIPTYTQPEVTEVARIFTGLKFPMGMALGYGRGPDGKTALVMQNRPVRYGRNVVEEKRHDTGEKSFLGTKLPAGQNTAKDIGDFLQLLCNHPNTAPFFAKGMIQHLVTSNPTPAYVKRVAQAFKASHGDMKTVVGTILLDPEARNPAYARLETYGKLREPWLRLTGLARAFNAIPGVTQPFYGDTARQATLRLNQYPLSAPSVFNFFLPNYQPPGAVSDRNARAAESATLLVAPEFQIMNSNTALLTPNYLMDVLRTEPGKFRAGSGVFALDLTPQINLAGDPAALVSNISTLLTGGVMSERTRGIITTAVNHITPATDPKTLKERARMAIYLTMISPDYAVQK